MCHTLLLESHQICTILSWLRNGTGPTVWADFQIIFIQGCAGSHITLKSPSPWSGQRHAHPRSFKTESYHPSQGRYRELSALPGHRSLATSRRGARQGPASPACKRCLRDRPHLPGPGLRASAPAAAAAAAAAFRCARALSQSRARPPPAAAVRLAPGRGRGTFALLLPARGRRRQRHRGHEL